MSKEKAGIRPFHFVNGELVKIEPADVSPWSIFATLKGLLGKVEAESTTMPGYYHVRLVHGLPGVSNVETSAGALHLIPWQHLHTVVVGYAA